MKTLIFLIALTAAAQYPPSSSNAKSLGGLPACSATVTTENQYRPHGHERTK